MGNDAPLFANIEFLANEAPERTGPTCNEYYKYWGCPARSRPAW